MAAQILLSLGLTACMFYVVSLGRSLPLVRLGLLAIVLAGYICIWFPETTNTIASWIGIGRGADLVMYIWILLNLFLILRLHLKLREQSEALTTLSRQMALARSDEA
jgi:small membrane protein